MRHYMNEAIQKLKGLRERKLKEVEFLQGQINDVKAVICGIDASIGELSNGTNIKADRDSPPLIGKYSDRELTPAVLDVVASYGFPPGLSATEICDKLREEGFKTKAKDLFASVYPVALRLLKQGKITEGTKNGKRSFVRKA